MARATRTANATTTDFEPALAHLRKVPGRMDELIATHGPPNLKRTRNSFQSLARAIIYQQLSGKAAGTIYGRFLALYPGQRFPRPETLKDTPFDDLRGVGLSRGKASYLLDLAAKYDDGTIKPRRFASMSNDELLETLTSVKGIGPWSVHMFMMFGLVRPDVLPVGDLGVRKGMQQYFGLDSLPSPATMESLAEPWRPYRTFGSWYMWRVLEE